MIRSLFDVDADVVWAAITERIPELKIQMVGIALSSDSSVQSED